MIGDSVMEGRGTGLGNVGLDYVSAKMRAIRSRLYEGERLRGLLGLGSVSALGERVLPGSRATSVRGLERSLVEAHVSELVRIWRHLSGRRGEFFLWLLARYPLENLKVIVRGRAGGVGAEAIGELVARFGEPLGLPLDELIAEGVSDEQLTRLRRRGVPGRALPAAWGEAKGDPFKMETMLEGGYFRELVGAMGRLGGRDRRAVDGLVQFEVDLANVMLALRGRTKYGMKAGEVEGYYVAGGRVGQERWVRFVEGPTPAEGAALLGVREESPTGIPELGWLAARRLYSLACRRFRESVLEYGAVAAFFHIKRTELADGASEPAAGGGGAVVRAVG